MSASKSIPALNSYEEIAEFWDTHSLADYWNETEPAEFEISEQVDQHYLVPVDRNLLLRIRQLARSRGVTIETLTVLSTNSCGYLSTNSCENRTGKECESAAAGVG